MPNKPAGGRRAASSSRPGSRLSRVVAGLRDRYGPIAPPPASTAFELVLWEKVAYLTNDARRTAAFRELKRRVGTTPRAILAAHRSVLEAICAMGGAVEIAKRADNMRRAAEYAIAEFDGDLDRACTLPFREAKRALQGIYGIGEPGAEKIMLLTHAHACLPLDSNGARVLLRLGYGADDKNYSRMYKSVVDAARPEAPEDIDWLIDAHVLLRHHGQETCKASVPRCELCAVRAACAYWTRASQYPRAPAHPVV